MSLNHISSASIYKTPYLEINSKKYSSENNFRVEVNNEGTEIEIVKYNGNKFPVYDVSVNDFYSITCDNESFDIEPFPEQNESAELYDVVSYKLNDKIKIGYVKWDNLGSRYSYQIDKINGLYVISYDYSKIVLATIKLTKENDILLIKKNNNILNIYNFYNQIVINKFISIDTEHTNSDSTKWRKYYDEEKFVEIILPKDAAVKIEYFNQVKSLDDNPNGGRVCVAFAYGSDPDIYPFSLTESKIIFNSSPNTIPTFRSLTEDFNEKGNFKFYSATRNTGTDAPLSLTYVSTFINVTLKA